MKFMTLQCAIFYNSFIVDEETRQLTVNPQKREGVWSIGFPPSAGHTLFGPGFKEVLCDTCRHTRRTKIGLTTKCQTNQQGKTSKK